MALNKLRSNFLGGKLTEPLSVGELYITGQGVSKIPDVVHGTQYMPITINPDGENNTDPEIVWVIEHAQGDDRALILRAQEGTMESDFPTDTYWQHASTAQDFADLDEAVADLSKFDVDYEGRTAQIIVPENSWYTSPTGYTITNPQNMHSGIWTGTTNYAGVGDTSHPHMVLDLQTSRQLSHIEYGLYTGDNRQYFGVSFATSMDGASWEWLEYRPSTVRAQNYHTPKIVHAVGRTAQYVRFTAYGSTANTGNHLEHFMVFELVDSSTVVTS